MSQILPLQLQPFFAHIFHPFFIYNVSTLLELQGHTHGEFLRAVPQEALLRHVYWHVSFQGYMQPETQRRVQSVRSVSYIPSQIASSQKYMFSA
jgi:hypothetical protein